MGLPPLLLAAEPPGAAFPASGWKRDFKRVWAKVDTNGQNSSPTSISPPAQEQLASTKKFQNLRSIAPLVTLLTP
ncbi:MAG: hypothetical protein V7L11_02810 [Nostoc sp.]|uniref:hypothetical protein n=1 Tax=Nostoc sp. TaxID=1180 RepID=UPI002FF5ED91